MRRRESARRATAGVPGAPRLVRVRAFLFVMARVTLNALPAQIPREDEFDHETARDLFGSNLLALTWIKGEPMPGELVDDILRGLGLERETDEQRRQRMSRRAFRQSPTARSEP